LGLSTAIGERWPAIGNGRFGNGRDFPSPFNFHIRKVLAKQLYRLMFDQHI
jgi:hypothetical protein